MLVAFSVKNFGSVKGEATLNMVASRDASHPENLIHSSGVRLLSSCALYGANASGKSTIIRALLLMRWLVINSASRPLADAPYPLKPFMLEPESRKQPTRFELTCLVNNTRFDYGFHADSRLVYEEWLHSYPKGQQRKLFTRTMAGDKATFKFGSHWEGDKTLTPTLTRPDALFLSVAGNFNHPICKPLVDWFRGKIRNVTWVPSNQSTNTQALSSPESKASILAFLKNADLGIAGFTVSETVSEKAADNRRATAERILRMYYRDKHEVTTLHSGRDASGEPTELVSFSLEEESEGAQKIYALAGLWLEVLTNGLILVADELDVRLHPLLTRHLVSAFHRPDTNPFGAQLIFATHDSGLLEPGLLRRDQVWFTEKDEQGSTCLYSLWEIKQVRKEENVRKGYLTGRYGAIPFVGAWPDLQEEGDDEPEMEETTTGKT